jgi:hypothetical protein
MAVSTKIPILTLFATDTAPTLQFTVNASGGKGAQDVTGATAKCHIRLIGATTNAFSGTAENCSINNGPKGRIDYSIPAGGITDTGVYHGQLEIIYSGGSVQRSQMFQINVGAGL